MLSLMVLLAAQTMAQSSDADLLAGMGAMRANDHRAAERSFTMALGAAPDDARTWYYRGVNRLAMGDAVGALRDLDRTLVLQPGDVHAMLRRAEVYVLQGQVAWAKGDLRSVLVHQGNGPAAEEALLKLAHFAMMEGDVQGAFKRYDQLVSIAPSNPTGYCHRGILLSTMSQDDAALLDLERAMELDPTLDQAHAHTGIVLLRMDRRQEACHALNTAYDLGDRSVEELLMIHCGR